jgi:hypothetical protein
MMEPPLPSAPREKPTKIANAMATICPCNINTTPSRKRAIYHVFV